MNENRSSRAWGIGIGVAALLVAMYVGGYYVTVHPWRYMNGETDPFYTEFDESWYHAKMDSILRELFKPMHWLDRRLRPHVWELTPRSPVVSPSFNPSVTPSL